MKIKKFENYQDEECKECKISREEMIKAILEFENSQDDGRMVDSKYYDKLKDEQIEHIYNRIYRNNENKDLKGKRIKMIEMKDDPDPIKPGTKGTVKDVDGLGQIHVDWDNGRTLAIIPEKDEYEIINEDTSTTATVGSGTAVGGGATGSFTSAAGQSVSGGDSGTAFSTNSNTAGMGDIVSAQPSDVPGDVAGSIPGSGDVSRPAGVYTKNAPKKKKKKKDKRKRKNNKTGSNIDKFYTTKYTEKYEGSKIITNWKTFNEEKNN